MQSKRNAHQALSPTRTEDRAPGMGVPRPETEPTNTQLRAMLALTDTAFSSLPLDDLLGQLLDRVTAVMGVDHIAIYLLDEDGHTLTVRAARGLLEGAVGRVQMPAGRGIAGRIAASRAPLIENDVSSSALDGVHPLLRDHLRSVVGVPLLVEDQPADDVKGHLGSRLIGVLGVGSATPRRFTETDVQLLQRAADRIALAIDRARLHTAEQNTRKCIEAALARAQESEAQASARAQQLHTILETMTDGVAVYDAAGRPIQPINRAYRELLALEHGPAAYDSLTTFERADLLHVRDAATGIPLPSEETPVGRALRGEVVSGSGADIRVRAFDGRELELNSCATPVREHEPDGRIVGAVLVLRDMTERNRLERERIAARADELAARAASRRMEDFLATAAHDLRAPLATVVGYLSLAQRQTERLGMAVRETSPDLASREKAVRDRLDDASQSAERLARLLGLLFDTAAIRAGKLELHRALCDLAALVREQVTALRVAVPDRTIHLRKGANRKPVLVEADADRIGQVVTNYVTNALKYSPPDRPVDVSVVVRRDRAHVAVCDQGPGIPEGERAKVWELFHRVPGVTAHAVTTRNDSPDGTLDGSMGLGLHISKAIITAHGGRVGVKSVMGQGSTFWFTMPLSPRQTRQE